MKFIREKCINHIPNNINLWELFCCRAQWNTQPNWSKYFLPVEKGIIPGTPGVLVRVLWGQTREITADMIQSGDSRTPSPQGWLVWCCRLGGILQSRWSSFPLEIWSQQRNTALPWRATASRQRQKAFSVHLLHLGCHPFIWAAPFKVGFLTSNNPMEKIPHRDARQPIQLIPDPRWICTPSNLLHTHGTRWIWF